METVANGALHQAGYDDVASVTHTVTSVTQGATHIEVDADYSFSARHGESGQWFLLEGQGTFTFDESGPLESIAVAAYVSDGFGPGVDFTYTSWNDLAAGTLDEFLAVVHEGPEGALGFYDVTKTTELFSTGPGGEAKTISATVTRDGLSTDVSVLEWIQDAGGGDSAVFASYSAVDEAGRHRNVQTDYTMTEGALGEVEATFTRYDVAVDGIGYSLQGASGSIRTVRVDDDTYRVSYHLPLRDASGSRFSVDASGEISLERGTELEASAEGWSWNGFAKATVSTAAAGAAGGAVAGAISTDGAAPAGAGVGAAVGAVAGGAAGAVGYTVGKAWDALFGGDDDEVEEGAGPEAPSVAGHGALPIGVHRAGTFFEGFAAGNFLSADFDATSRPKAFVLASPRQPR